MSKFSNFCLILWDTPWRISLRHYVTSPKVAGSMGIFHRYITFGRMLALGSSQILIKMIIRYIS